jgi:hypothetical protein
MNTMRPEMIWELERRRRDGDVDHRLPLTLSVPGREPEMSEKKEVAYVLDFDQGEE